MTIEYKILFEVRFLHDHYLMDKSGNSFFTLSSEEQHSLLQKKIRDKRYDIHNDLKIFFSRKEVNILKNFRLKYIKTPLGFYIAIEVKSEITSGGIIRYKPAIRSITNQDIILTFGLSIANPMFGNMNNIQLNRNNMIYYFSNKGEHSGRSLSKSISKIKENQTYKMGDLVLRGDKIYQAIEDNVGNEDKWQPILGNGFVHQGDISLNMDDDFYKDWSLNLSHRPLAPVGMIQIFTQVEDIDYSPIDDEGYLVTQKLPDNLSPTHPIFEMRFLSRATYWRYKKTDGFSTDEINHIKENSQGILTLQNNSFVTVKPKYLSQETTPLGVNSFRLPNASLNSIKAEQGRLYSDIYFNSINPIPNYS